MKLLTSVEQKMAKDLYYSFFKKTGQKNPTDLNTPEKYHFAVEIGYELFRLMQLAREFHTARNNFPYRWTHLGYWEDRLDSDQGKIHNPAPLYTYKQILKDNEVNE